MRITSFYPMIVTKDAESIKHLFEEMGFEVRHDVLGTTETDYRLIVMRDEDKHRVDIAEAETEKGQVLIRMNVDDFDEAVSYFEALGYSIFGTVHETESAMNALLTKGDGTYMVLFHHKK